MVEMFGWAIAIIELVVIVVLVQALNMEREAKMAALKWIAKREILRKFHEDR